MMSGTENTSSHSDATALPHELPQARALAGPPRLPAGARIGRYVVAAEIGDGAMGVVYEAYDPKLERRVAIKVLIDNSTDETTQQSLGQHSTRALLAEARALAKIDHPNVVSVFDVGVHDGAPYLAMELLVGCDLRTWLDAGPRPWRESSMLILQVLDGLERVHRAGLVHRDIKPANIFITEDGCAKLVDFGIAESSTQAATSGAVGLEETQPAKPGVIAGTPAYMAPEQLHGYPATQKCDQFSICVTLYEAIWGVRPFDGIDRAQQLQAIEQGQVSAPVKGLRGPRALRRALEPGLAARPGQRYADIGELRRAIGRALESYVLARPTFWVTSILSVGLFATLASAITQDTDGARCMDALEDWAGVWDDDIRDQAADAFAATQLPHAGSTWAAISGALDQRRSRFESLLSELCIAQQTGVAAGSNIDFERQIQCLDARIAATAPLTQALQSADEKLVDSARTALAALPQIEACASLDQLQYTAPAPNDPRLAPRVHQLRTRLWQIRISGVTGRDHDIVEELEALLEDAQQLGEAALLAEILLLSGTVKQNRYAPFEARQALQEALILAESTGHDFVTAEAVMSLAFVEGYMLRDTHRLWDLVAHAEAHAQRTAHGFRVVGRLEHTRASVALVTGDLQQARAHFRAAFEFEVEHGSGDEYEIAIAQNNVAVMDTRLGHRLEAIRQFSAVLDRLEQHYDGPHPDMALGMVNRAKAMREVGRWSAADRELERVAELFRKTLGADHPLNLRGRSQHAWVGFLLGRRHWALEQIERSISDRRQRFGERDPEFVDTHGLHALILAGLGQRDAAIRVMDSIVAHLVDFPLPRGELHDRMLLLAQVEILLGRGDLASRWLDQIPGPWISAELADECERYGKAEIHALHGSAARLRGELDEAEQRMRRAWTMARECADPDSVDPARYGFEFARTLHQLGHFDEAEQRAREALREWERVIGPDSDPTLDVQLQLAVWAKARNQPKVASKAIKAALRAWRPDARSPQLRRAMRTIAREISTAR